MITSLERAKKGLGLADPSIDVELESQLLVASDLIEQACKRRFKRQIHVETCSKFQGNYLLLRNYPLHEVHGITAYDGNSINDFEKGDYGMLFRRSGWPYGERSLIVKYEAGYTLPTEEELPERPIDIPRPLEMACTLYAQKLMASVYVPLGVQKERLGEMSVTYTKEQLECNIPTVVAALIRPYRRGYG